MAPSSNKEIKYIRKRQVIWLQSLWKTGKLQTKEQGQENRITSYQT